MQKVTLFTMAHQAGPLRLKGKLGDLSFYYNRQYGYLVRQKGGPGREQIAASPSFERTRENASEFSLAASAGKLIRRAVRASTGLSGDADVSQRLTGLLIRMGKTDLTAVRGMRNPVTVFNEPASRELLRSFAFYGSRPVSTMYTGQIVCDVSAGSIGFMGSISCELFRAPKGATHVGIKAAIVVLDFEHHSYTSFQAPVYNARLEDPMEAIEFNLDAGSATDLRIGVMTIEFLQEQNGELYALADGVSLGIVG